MLLDLIPLIAVSRRFGYSKPNISLKVYGHYLPGMQKVAAAMMAESVTPISTKLQQFGSNPENPIRERLYLTKNVAVTESNTATYLRPCCRLGLIPLECALENCVFTPY